MTDYRCNCPAETARNNALQTRKRTLLGTAGAVGKLEVLNDFGRGGGKIRETLQTLADSSNALRTGGSSGIGGTVIGNTANDILSSMGLNQEVQNSVAQFDPGAVNGAVGAAKVLASDVQNGRFTFADIPNRIQDFQNLESIASKIFRDPVEGNSAERELEKFQCNPSPYAVDLIDRAPKQNFQFIVDIKLHAEYASSIGINLTDRATRDEVASNVSGTTKEIKLKNNVATELAFMVKSTNRPGIAYDYEDANYYNYRTKAIRMATFNPINMRFIDDQQNNAATFYAMYVRAMSPITNISGDNAAAVNDLENFGMEFPRPDTEALIASRTDIFPLRSSSIGTLLANRKTIVREISIYQFGKNSNTITAYNMINPKITNFELSEATMEESGAGQEFSFDFEYDYFYINPEIPIAKFGVDRLLELSGEGVGAEYPILYTSSGFIDPDGKKPVSKAEVVKSALTAGDTTSTTFPGINQPSPVSSE